VDVRLTVSCTVLEQLSDLLALVRESCKRAGLSDGVSFKAQVVLEEFFVNIFRHAYPEGRGRAEFSLEATENEIFLRIEDWGPPFDPLAAEPGDPEERFARGIPGGAGLVLMRKIGQNPRYVREDGRNIVELRVSSNEHGRERL
jgi:anti-sigma regulatory factor (Ser/Thr protein kinase)